MTGSDRPLRIAQVVTLVSPDGAYGGPTRVALNQAKALMERGHEVTILAGARGFDRLPETYDSVPVRLFPVRHLVPGSGFAGLFSAGLMAHLLRHIRDYDVVHVHLARDLVTLPAARMAQAKRVPFVAQTHGMIDASSRLLARPLDQFLTRPVLRSARSVLHLTAREASDVSAVAEGSELRLELLSNGVPAATPTPWHTRTPLDVLFLARLHERKRPRTFVEAAGTLVERFPDVTFSLVGPDEGEEEAVRALARELDPSQQRIRVEGPLQPNDTIERMRRSALYVLPAANEPFGMTVLEAMSVGVPVVVLDDCGLSGAVQEAGAGIVVNGTAASIADGIAVLLADEPRRASAGTNALTLVQQSFSMSVVAERLDSIYREARAEVHAVGDRP